MRRLNIPLHRYQQTTRLPRRVVSLITCVVATGFVLLIAAGSLWYDRDTTSAAAPEGTRMVIHVSPNRFSWDDAARTFGNISLISDRPLVLTDIQSFTKGEFSIFVGEDGARSLAVRSRAEDLPIEVLDTLGIMVQETKRGVYLLSSTPLARMEWKPKKIWMGAIHWPNSRHLGSVHLIDDETVRGALYVSKKQVRVRLPKQAISNFEKMEAIPEETIAFLSTPVLPTASIHGTTKTIDTILSSFETPSAAWIVERLTSTSGSILLAEQDGALQFLFTAKSTDFNREQQQKLIQTAVALQSPKIQQMTLPDNTRAPEIIVDPSLTTVEETTIAGTPVSRVATGDDHYLFAAERDESFVITNNQRLLEHWFSWKKEVGANAKCAGNVAFMNLDAFSALFSDSLVSREPNLLQEVAGHYTHLAIKQTFFSTNLLLCY